MDDTLHASGVHPAPPDLTADEMEQLLDIAETAIRARLGGSTAPASDPFTLPATLRRPCGSFVTLHVAGELNGCIGNLGGSGTLADDVAGHAVKAAFSDPRLPVLRYDDLALLDIDVSLLSSMVEVPARSRDELLHHLRPGEHGLVIRSAGHQAVFLPAVWKQLPRPNAFIDHLLHKAGLRHDTWPPDLAAAVFTATSFHRDLG